MSDFEKRINASDLIEWIMETYPDWCVGAVRSIVDHVENLPSAQPEETQHAYEQGRIQGHVEMRTELLMQLKGIVGDEVWSNI